MGAGQGRMKTYKVYEKKIIIYGTGSMGKVLLENVPELKVEFFLDMRGEDIEDFRGYAVHSLQELSQMQLECEDYVIIISIRNVFEHEEIARKLYEIGFTNIIYKAKAILRDYKDQRMECINEAYEELLVKRSMPKYDIFSLIDKDFVHKEENYVIQEDDQYITMFLLPELLFTNYLPDNRWSRVNFVSTYILVDLYCAFEGTKNIDFERAIEDYIINFVLPEANKIGITTGEKWKRITISTRKKIYYEMSVKLAVDPLFFVRSCPMAKYLGKGSFSLVSSGKNRVSFLIAKGQKMIPVKVTRDDYNTYLNKDVAEELKQYLQNNKIYTLPVPIEHPFFYEYPTEAVDYFEKWGSRIGKRLSEFISAGSKTFDFNEITICDCLEDWGSLGRYLNMLGCVLTRLENKDDDIIKRIDDLFYIDSEEFYNCNNHYTAGLISSRSSYAILKKCLPKIDAFCFVLCENHDYDVIEKIKAERFCLESRVFSSIWGENIVEGFIFYKES